MKIIPFPLVGITRLDYPVEEVLERAKSVGLTGVVILGYTEDGDYFGSSYADGGTVLWLLEQCKKRLLEIL